MIMGSIGTRGITEAHSLKYQWPALNISIWRVNVLLIFHDFSHFIRAE